MEMAVAVPALLAPHVLKPTEIFREKWRCCRLVSASHVGYQNLKSTEVLVTFVQVTHDMSQVGNMDLDTALKTENSCDPL